MYSNLDKIVEKTSQQMADKHFLDDKNKFNISICPEQIVYTEWLAGLLINNAEFRLIFRTHFSLDQLIKNFKNPPVDEDKKQKIVFDLVKEYCNISAGKIKAILENQDIKSGLSIPFVTSGFDEYFFMSEKTANKHKTQFLLTFNETKIFICYEIDIKDETLRSKLISLNPDLELPSNDGELELL